MRLVCCVCGDLLRFHDEVTADLTVVLPISLAFGFFAIYKRDNQDATFRWTTNEISGLLFIRPCFVLYH